MSKKDISTTYNPQTVSNTCINEPKPKTIDRDRQNWCTQKNHAVTLWGLEIPALYIYGQFRGTPFIVRPVISNANGLAQMLWLKTGYNNNRAKSVWFNTQNKGISRFVLNDSILFYFTYTNKELKPLNPDYFTFNFCKQDLESAFKNEHGRKPSRHISNNHGKYKRETVTLEYVNYSRKIYPNNGYMNDRIAEYLDGNTPTGYRPLQHDYETMGKVKSGRNHSAPAKIAKGCETDKSRYSYNQKEWYKN